MSLIKYIHGDVLEYVTTKVRNFIKKYDPPRIYVFFSAGKDSTAALAAVAYAGDSVIKRTVIVYNELVGNTHRLNVETAYHIVEKLGFDEPVVIDSPPYHRIAVAVHKGARVLHIRARNRYGEDFWTSVERWGMPVMLGTRHRWCYAEFKEKHWYALPTVAGGRRYSIIGVKINDSHWRRARWRDVDVKTWSKMFMLRSTGMIEVQMSPVLKLTDDEVWMLLRDVGLNKELRTYEMCGDSLNCMFCPFRRREKQKRIVECLAKDDVNILMRVLEALKSLKRTKENSITMVKAREWMELIEQAIR